MGCGFWGMSKGKAAAERMVLNVGAPPVALGLGDRIIGSQNGLGREGPLKVI